MSVDNPLAAAIARDDLSAAEQALTARPESVEQRDAQGKTPLMQAVERGAADLARLLIDRGADVNAVQYPHTGSGAVSGFATNAEMIGLLKAAGCAVNDPRTDSCPPLLYAASEGKAALMNAWLDAGGNANSRHAHGDNAIHCLYGVGATGMPPEERHGIMRRLLAAGLDPNARGQQNETPLMRAASANDADGVKVLLAAGADPNAERGAADALLDTRDEATTRALLQAAIDPRLRRRALKHAARDLFMNKARAIAESFDGEERRLHVCGLNLLTQTAHGSAEAFEKAVEEAAGARVITDYGTIALAKAVTGLIRHEPAERCRRLLAAGADPDPQSDEPRGVSAIEAAVKDIALMRLILPHCKKGPSLDKALIGVCGQTPFVDWGDKGAPRPDTRIDDALDEKITILLEAGANVNARSDDGHTPLSILNGRHPYNLERVLAAGADPNLADRAGRTPLMNATPHNSERLIAAGADARAASHGGQTALHFCRQVTKARLLKDHGADLDARDARGETPLMAVAFAGCMAMIEWLLQNGAAIGLVDEKGNHALMHAAMRSAGPEMLECVQRLQQAGENPRQLNKAGWSLVTIACRWTNLPLLDYALAQGCPIDHQDAEGDTGLMHAVQFGTPGMAPAVLERGADRFLKNRKGETALQKAQRIGNRELAALLERTR
jgi:ankyrin repeat protein